MAKYNYNSVSFTTVLSMMAGLLAFVVSYLPPGASQMEMDANAASYKQCAIKQLDLAALAGDWQLAYYMDPLKGLSVGLKLQVKDSNSLTGSLSINGRSHLVNLTRTNPAQPGLLLNVLPSKKLGTVHIPVVVIAAEPTKFFATWQEGVGNPTGKDWAIYKRPSVSTLDKHQIEQATGGLKCLGEGDKNGGIIIFAVS